MPEVTGTALLENAVTPVVTHLVQQPEPTLTLIPLPPRRLRICLASEPEALFWFGASSSAAQSVLAALYDGPFEIQNYTPVPVILQDVPSVSNGGAELQTVEVHAGEPIVDAEGNLTSLEVGTSFRPSGCNNQSCAQVYNNGEPVIVDQLVLRFHLIPDLLWSDGMPLTASDSVYAFEIAQQLFPAFSADLLRRTQSYQAVDDLTVEWRGIPGYVDARVWEKFFPPLPLHAWQAVPVEELASAEISARTPLGWGPYVMNEWISGDHILMKKNPLYFRAVEGLPYFDELEYLFVADGESALQMLLGGECDVVDQTARLENEGEQLTKFQAEGAISLAWQAGTSWEQITFGIVSLTGERPAYFGLKEVRQAIALCIDRQALAAQFAAQQVTPADAYIPSSHPLYNPQSTRYSYDPQQAASLLESAGWIDDDGDPATPRIAQAVPGVWNETPFKVAYLVSPAGGREGIARAIQKGLSQCGIGVDLILQDFTEYLAPGPQGAVFGRNFDLAQFSWAGGIEPPCYLYIASEIPGAYPDYPKGWGGANASGFNSQDYDWACREALYSLPESPQHQQAHGDAQVIFAQELPSIPLFWRSKVLAGRTDLCGVKLESLSASLLTGIEAFNYGESCK